MDASASQYQVSSGMLSVTLKNLRWALSLARSVDSYMGIPSMRGPSANRQPPTQSTPYAMRYASAGELHQCARLEMEEAVILGEPPKALAQVQRGHGGGRTLSRGSPF